MHARTTPAALPDAPNALYRITRSGRIYIDDFAVRGCYLLHFDTPYKHAGHYLGWSHNISKRIRQHRRGRGAGSALTDAVAAAGIGITVVRIWPNTTRLTERQLHRRHGNPRLCPICHQSADIDF